MEKLVDTQNVMLRFKYLVICSVISLALYSCSGAKRAAGTNSSAHTTVPDNKQVNRKAIVNYARTFIDVPYKYGGNTPKEGFDCSGYIKYVYNKFDVSVPRVTRDYVNFGQRVALSKVKLGDLILFSLYDKKNTIGHIGIVSKIEKDKIFFLHAASGKRSGKVMESELYGIHVSRMLFITRVIE